MDRLDALACFVAVADQGSFVGAARRLGRSPAAVTRAVAALEDRLATRLFNRTTRAVGLTDAGGRYLELCRRLLADVEELESAAASDRVEPSGLLTVSAPVVFGRLHVQPVALTFLRDFPSITLRLLLLDRIVSLVDEGVDLSIRLAQLPDSSLRAVSAGAVRRAVYASPDYLARHGMPTRPEELADHACIAFGSLSTTVDRWPFGPDESGPVVAVRPRLVVNTAEAAIDAAIAGLGVTRVLSYQADPWVAAGRLQAVLQGHETTVPIQLVHPAGRHLPAKVRVFIDRAVASLRARFGDG
jgi:DNA-binding transcriptional LysR family regulator